MIIEIDGSHSDKVRLHRVEPSKKEEKNEKKK